MNLINLNLKSTKNRPRIKLEKTNLDILLEVIAFVVLIYLWYFVLKNYSNLPETIATHFNSAGKVDDFGSKSTILLLPGIGTFIYILLSIINNFPHIFNYLVEITQENAARQYKLAVQMIRFLKVDIIGVFTFLTKTIIQDAVSNSSDLGIWFLPTFLGLTFIPIIFYMIQMVKQK